MFAHLAEHTQNKLLTIRGFTVEGKKNITGSIKTKETKIPKYVLGFFKGYISVEGKIGGDIFLYVKILITKILQT